MTKTDKCIHPPSPYLRKHNGRFSAWAARRQRLHGLVVRICPLSHDPAGEIRCDWTGCSGCRGQNAKSLPSAANCQLHHDGYEND